MDIKIKINNGNKIYARTTANAAVIKTNIIVVPHNIYSQWVISIEKYSENLSYKKSPVSH
jgi:hypothetical protein